jgi:hypothetical protein
MINIGGRSAVSSSKTVGGNGMRNTEFRVPENCGERGGIRVRSLLKERSVRSPPTIPCRHHPGIPTPEIVPLATPGLTGGYDILASRGIRREFDIPEYCICDRTAGQVPHCRDAARQSGIPEAQAYSMVDWVLY